MQPHAGRLDLNGELAGVGVGYDRQNVISVFIAFDGYPLGGFTRAPRLVV